MNDSVRDQLRKALEHLGKGALEEPRRLEAVLRDLCPKDQREIASLLAALRAGVPQAIVGSASRVPWEMLESRLVTEILDQMPLTPDAANWAIRSWAEALRIPLPSRPAAPQQAATGGEAVDKDRFWQIGDATVPAAADRLRQSSAKEIAMALVSCPECNREISTMASSCPHCGFPTAMSPARATAHTPPSRIRRRWPYALILVILLVALASWGTVAMISSIERKKRDEILVASAKAQAADPFVAAVMTNDIAKAESLLSESYRTRLAKNSESIESVIKKIDQSYDPRGFSYWPKSPNEIPPPKVSPTGTEIALGGQFGYMTWAKIGFKLVRDNLEAKWKIDDIAVSYGRDPKFQTPNSGTGAVPQEPVTNKMKKKGG